MNPFKHLDPLEELLSSALIEHSNVVKGRKAISTKHDFNTSYRASFTRPENWKLGAQVRLIHVEGSVHTLVGLFDEFLHSYVPRCRRLVATTATNEALPQRSETVTGEHWLPGEVLSFKRQPSERSVELPLNLVLDMGQHLSGEAILCKAFLVGGGLQRLVLLQDAIFEGNAPRTILSLPEGLDVLEGLLGGCKVLVWRSINEELVK